MAKFSCLVLDHDDTVVQSEATVNYPCFCRFLERFRPGCVYSYADYLADCGRMDFTQLCRVRFSMTEAELEEEYRFWKDYAGTHIPDPYPGMGQLLHACREAGIRLCVSSMSSRETILRDYRAHYGLEPDLIFGWELPPQQRKPSPYAPEQIKARFGLLPEQLLVVDDMPSAVPMARAAGCPIAFAGWGRQAFPQLSQQMNELCDYSFSAVSQLEDFLFSV